MILVKIMIAGGIHMEIAEDIMDFSDCTGKQRKFRFKTIEAAPPLIRMEAHEIREDGQPGYYFREIDTADHLVLLRGNLNLKIKEALSKRYIIEQKEGYGKWEMLTDELKGYVDFDEVLGEICLVMDGYKVTWEEFKDLLSAYEGFFIKIKFED
jgi:hypothetical protein